MASPEHCLHAFEALSANLERRQPMELEDIQKSWKAFQASSPSPAAEPPKPAAFQRLTSSKSGVSSSSSSSTMSLSASTPATSVSSLPSTDDPLITESPLFVTWNLVTPDGHRSLRGCIGTFEDQELDEGISSYALTSALHDTRFSPIRSAELPSLEVSVTLLTDFEDCDDELDWEVGTHGLRISFALKGRRYGATYLPDVASEQGWGKEETLLSLMRKAGWMGKRDRWREVELDCVRYQGRKESLSFAEYKRWRAWVDETGWVA